MKMSDECAIENLILNVNIRIKIQIIAFSG